MYIVSQSYIVTSHRISCCSPGSNIRVMLRANGVSIYKPSTTSPLKIYLKNDNSTIHHRR